MLPSLHPTGHNTAPSQRPRPRIGVFIAWLTDGYVDPIIDELARLAAERNVDVVCFVGTLELVDLESPARNPTFALVTPDLLDGILLVTMGTAASEQQTSDYLRRFEPLPMCSMTIPCPGRTHVAVNNETGLREGIGHLITAHKRRRIACLRGPPPSKEAEMRFKVYQEVLREHGLPYDEELVTDGWFSQEHGRQAVKIWIDERGAVFDAIVCANDGMALGVLQELDSRGIRVPEQVSLLGFDDTEDARFARPPISTVKQPLRLHTQTALDTLLAQIRGEPVPLVTLLPSELVLRRSCGCIAASTPGASPAPRPRPSLPVPASPLGMILAPLINFFRDDLGASLRTELSASFAWLAERGDHSEFLGHLEQLLDNVAQHSGDVSRAFRQLDLVYENALAHYGGDPIAWDRVERALTSALTLVGEVVERVQALRRQQLERQMFNLIRVNESLSSCMDLVELQRTLTRSLAVFHVPRAFLCLYADEQVPVKSARVALAHHAGRELSMPPEGITFACQELLPFRLALADKPSMLLVCPLLRGEARIPGYVVFERGLAEGVIYDGLLDVMGSAYRRTQLIEQLVRETRRREIAERQRIEEEMLIAQRIQLGVLPNDAQIAGLEFSAATLPASEVGGDYYDVMHTALGPWLGIGDVSGHGLPAGLVMLMLQSVLAGLVQQSPTASPAALLTVANRVLYENIRQRMKQNEFVTLTLFRYLSAGKFSFAGAHEEILIYRVAENCVETLPTPGTWLGAVRDIEQAVEDRTLELDPGDVMLLYTDGITEARNEEGTQFGIERLKQSLLRLHDSPTDRARDLILEEVHAWQARQEDDLTLVLIRRQAD